MSFVDRIGLSLVSPREAALEARAGDVVWLLAARVAAGETPRLARALERGLEGGVTPALMGLVGAAAAVLPDVLGILIGAILLAFFVRRRPTVDVANGDARAATKAVADRTLDVAAAAWVPYLFVQLCGALLWTAIGRPMTPTEETAVDVIAVGWASAVWLVGLVEFEARAMQLKPLLARIAGIAVVVGLLTMFALNSLWIVRNVKSLGGTKPGQPAPELTLPLLDGGNARLSQWRGHVVVLSFWATWCAPCIGELPDVQTLYDQLSPGGVIFLAVDVDGGAAADVAPAVRAFRQRLGLRLPIALDDGTASQAYRVDTIPRTIVIDRQGTVARSLDGAHSLEEMRSAIEAVRAL